MWFSYRGSTGPSAGLIRVSQTLDALKRSARILFAQQNSLYTYPTLEPALSLVELPYAEGDECSTTHLSGVALAASLGLKHIYTLPLATLWHVSPQNGSNNRLCLPVSPSPYELDLNADAEVILGDDALNTRALTLSTHPSTIVSESTCLTPSTRSFNGSTRPRRGIVLSPASKSPLSSIASTPYASSSASDSDSSFEVASPYTDNVDIPASLNLSNHGPRNGSDDAEDCPKASDIDAFSRRIETEVLALIDRLDEEARPHTQNEAPETAAEVNPDDAGPPLSPELFTADTADDADETSSTILGASGYDDDSDDDEGAVILSSPYSGERYVIEGVVASGASGRVVRALDSKGHWRAVKMVLKSKVFEWPDARENLLREKAIMARVSALDTWRLAYLYESWEDEYLIYFVMEHAPCSLHYLIAPPSGATKIDLSESDERQLCVEMIAALSLLHANDIVHRDIKPDNFLVDSAGGIVLTDFGLSLETDPNGVIRGVCGTEDYLAPEQRMATSYNSKVDVWQLACTFIELFARLRGTWMGTFDRGNNPLARSDLRLEEIQEVLNRSAEDLIPANHPGRDLVLEMIRLYPEERPTMEELKTYPWFKGIEWETVASGPSVERGFKPRHVPINPHHSPAYSTFFYAPPEPRGTAEVEEIIQMQMAMYEVEPYAFVYPPLDPDDPEAH